MSAKHHRTLIFLPPYSPELNPIENSWHHLKSIIRDYAHLFHSLYDTIHFAFQVF
ncbi:MAG: transposase [Ruminococcus sp.]|nr:transposase [Ruminococcus sp.]